MLLTQICNVGSIVGGTAACAWSVTRALPDWRHRVIFLSPVSAETRRVFLPVKTYACSSVSANDVCGNDGCTPDVVMFHNTPSDRCGQLAVPTIGYRHSQCRMISADVRVDCSRWLAGQGGNTQWLWQGVPQPRSARSDSRATRDELLIGRICTPRVQKWPEESVTLTAKLAATIPTARWEFVGCPKNLEARFRNATNDRVTFIPASWSGRDRLAEWDLLVYSNSLITESFGRTVAEAMRAGCVPIVDRRGGFVEQLDSGGGVLCESAEDFVDAIQRLADPFERRVISRRAVAIGEERFSIAAFRGRLLKILNAAATGAA